MERLEHSGLARAHHIPNAPGHRRLIMMTSPLPAPDDCAHAARRRPVTSAPPLPPPVTTRRGAETCIRPETEDCDLINGYNYVFTRPPGRIYDGEVAFAVGSTARSAFLTTARCTFGR